MKLQNIVDCSNNDPVISSLKCELKSCPNEAGCCYIVNNVHLKVFPIHIKAWSIAINEGTAILDMPPAILVKSLIPAKQSLFNPLRFIPKIVKFEFNGNTFLWYSCTCTCTNASASNHLPDDASWLSALIRPSYALPRSFRASPILL